MSTESSRRELARFLRSRRERITPGDVGLPTGPRRRTTGLRREEVAVLAGLSPTWYTYLEQGRGIQPSREVLDSLARVLRLTEDERRYMHTLAYGQAIRSIPLEADVSAGDLVRRIVAVTEQDPHPVYALNMYCDVIAWNRAATQWYDDWGRMDARERNILHWMLTSPQARTRLLDWEDDTRDIIARWRRMTAQSLDDDRLQARIADLTRLSPDFVRWWGDHDVQEHRTRIRHFMHPETGVHDLRLVVLEAPEFTPSFVVFHLPVQPGDLP